MKNDAIIIDFTPICPTCEKKLKGPVRFCPYCGTNLLPIPHLIIEEQTKKDKTQKAEKDSNGAAQHGEKKQGQEIIDIPQASQIPKKIKPEPRKKDVWITLAVVIIVIAAFAVWSLIGRNSFKGPNGSSLEQPPKNAKQEAARVLALGALRYGTDLSIAVSKLPKMEMVHKSAKKLLELSPRYKTQVDQAKKMLDSVREERDKCLMACMDKLLQLGRYPPDAITFAVRTVKNGDLLPREKMVWDLLEGYLNELGKEKEADPKRWLSDFSKKFSNFIE